MSEKVTSMGNIQRVIAVDMVAKTPAPYFDSSGNFVDEGGFFIRAATAGTLKYCPLGNKSDAEAISKTFDASNIFVDPEVCRKIIHVPTTPATEATDIFVGWGV